MGCVFSRSAVTPASSETAAETSENNVMSDLVTTLPSFNYLAQVSPRCPRCLRSVKEGEEGRAMQALKSLP